MTTFLLGRQILTASASCSNCSVCLRCFTFLFCDMVKPLRHHWGSASGMYSRWYEGSAVSLNQLCFVDPSSRKFSLSCTGTLFYGRSRGFILQITFRIAFLLTRIVSQSNRGWTDAAHCGHGNLHSDCCIPGNLGPKATLILHL